MIIKISKRKWIIIAAVIAYLLLAGIVLLLMSQPAQPRENSARVVPSPTTISEQMPTITAPTITTQSYVGQTYTITYPSEWTATRLELLNGGEFTTFRPINQKTGEKEYYPSAVVAVEPIAGSISISDKVAIYERFGMQKTIISFHGTQGTKVSGTFPIKIVNGQPTRAPVQKTLVFIEKSGNLYTLKYYYDGNRINPYYEQYFDNLFANFIFTR